MADFEHPSRLKGKMPSRLIGKSLEKTSGSQEQTSNPELKEGAILVNADLAAEDPKKAEFRITGVVEQEGRGTVYFLESSIGIKTSKTEKTLKEEIERGKYRLKE